ncbi:MAG: DUF2279 domain-containing protein [Ignavibacteriales bacterium]|nr:DUF2279 domain-containing protein [Ignavibacteriales bacterium]
MISGIKSPVYFFLLLILGLGQTNAFSSDNYSTHPDPSDITFQNILIESDTTERVNSTRLALVGGTFLTTMAVIHIYQQNGWWKGNRAPFHFREDLVYGLWLDKIGHFYGGAILGYTMSKSLEWANVPEEKAVWIGSGGGLLFQSYVEIEDGFSKWGFDRVDWAFDLGGAALPVLKYYYPSLKNFDLKFSYHPSALLGNPGGIGFRGQKHLMVDDYEGQTFWLSFKVHNLIPESVEMYWPSFLCLSIGYGARGIADPNPRRVYYIAPDIDMTKIIPDNTKFLKALGEALNFIHLPMPAVQFSSNKPIWFGLYF